MINLEGNEAKNWFKENFEYLFYSKNMAWNFEIRLTPTDPIYMNAILSEDMKIIFHSEVVIYDNRINNCVRIYYDGNNDCWFKYELEQKILKDRKEKLELFILSSR